MGAASSELVDMLANASSDDLRQIDAEIQEQEAYLGKLKGVRKVLTTLVGDAKPRAKWGSKKAEAATKASNEPDGKELGDYCDRVAKVLQTESPLGMKELMSKCRMNAVQLNAALKDDWFEQLECKRWQLSAKGREFGPV